MKRTFDKTPTNMNTDKLGVTKGRIRYGDPKLLTRMEDLLANHKNKAVASSDWMVDQLQIKHQDYGRKKKLPFKKSVEKAHQFLIKQLAVSAERDSENKNETDIDGQHSHSQRKRQKISSHVLDHSSESDCGPDDDNSFSEENPDYTSYPDTNSMNNFMANMYKNSTRTRSSNKPSSQQSSAAASPRRTEDSYDRSPAPFVIDRTGETKRKKSIRPCDSPIPVARQSSDTSQVSAPTGNQFANESGKHHDSDEMNHEQNDNVFGSRNHGPLDVSAASMSPKPKQIKSSFNVTTPSKNKRGQNKADSKEAAGNPIANKLRDSGKSREGTPDRSERVEKHTGKKKKREKENPDRASKSPAIEVSSIKFADIGGSDATLKEVCKLLVHMKHPEIYIQLGITPPRGFLLHGPPGCGKTLLAHAIAGELELPFIKLAATEIVSGVSGESEEKVRDIFEKAMTNSPCILFIDEIDAITQKRETASKDMERRIVSQLLTCMDDLSSKANSQVLVIGATNRPDSLDPALRRAGRFDREISLGIPDETARTRILEVLCRGLKLPADFDFSYLSRQCPGFVGADLMALCREAAVGAVSRVFKMLKEGSLDRTISTDEQDVKLETCDVQIPSNKPSVDAEESTVPSDKIETIDKALPNGDVVKDIDDILHVDAHIDENRTVGNTVDLTISTNSKDTSHLASCDQDDRTQLDFSQTQVQKEGCSDSQNPDDEEFKLLLSWLKDQPPLTAEQLESLWITADDFMVALKHVQPSAKREGFATVPDVTWSDVGALKDVREELQIAILAPVRHPEKFASLGLTNPPGILLAGPPGCGKTLLAKAVANESGINFISVKGPELLNMYVGESERAVRQVFQRARNSSPCVIFFDELDALCPRRSGAGEGGSSVRVVNQLLTEMDGLEERKQVFIMGATNRPDIIDPAVLRPGRLDKQLFVGLPTLEDREDILKTITKNGQKPKLASDVDFHKLAEDGRCCGYTGADLAALVREAAVTALKEAMLTDDQGPVIVCSQHFNVAFSKVKPSVQPKDLLMYEQMKKRLTTS